MRKTLVLFENLNESTERERTGTFEKYISIFFYCHFFYEVISSILEIVIMLRVEVRVELSIINQ